MEGPQNARNSLLLSCYTVCLLLLHLLLSEYEEAEEMLIFVKSKFQEKISPSSSSNDFYFLLSDLSHLCSTQRGNSRLVKSIQPLSHQLRPHLHSPLESFILDLLLKHLSFDEKPELFTK